ncbi:DUF3969 family protein [Xenorhabdus sp. XENO-10]|uniref:DUF3969 family protein n=1 Tax=Xenorhabdus yunnanensis TaxID=3025878 RepID=A0ABT5LKR5_9GAMM|nr:DUF3969 family protein [Xenorhabdus yunnanensis]MDC9591716.1 DUF3969 family protein [Xenorhabdus yunnanensis]
MKKKLCYCLEEKYAAKFFSFLILGVLHSLDKKLISINEAEGFVFQPDIIRTLKEIKAPRKLIKIADLGTELDGVESLIPHELSAEINKLIRKTLSVIKNSEKVEEEVLREREIKRF